MAEDGHREYPASATEVPPRYRHYAQWIGQRNKMGQLHVNPDYLFFEAPRSPAFQMGSELVKEAIKRSHCDFSVAYPITPQSECSALVGELWKEGYVGDYLRGENEFGVMSQIAGAAMGGARTFTTTAGPGTLRAFENFPMWCGTRVPVVILFTVRGVNSPLSIQPDTLEIDFMLDTGFILWHAESAQEEFDFLMKAYIVAEQPSVHLPIGVCVDGFFITHTKESVMLPPDDICLPPYNPYVSPVVTMDMEIAPSRNMRDPFVMKSNYIHYATHMSWQQEVRAAIERSRKFTIPLLDGLVETHDLDASVLIVASGCASAQGREAIRLLTEEGVKVGLVKVKTLRPWPWREIQEATKNAKLLVIPEFNVVGWMAREVAATIDNNRRIIAGPRVGGGMTLPPEIIAEEILLAIKQRNIPVTPVNGKRLKPEEIVIKRRSFSVTDYQT